MILLKSISLENFLSHAKTTIDVKADSRLLIDGASGSGKSSIVEALIWCLYGVARVDNRSLIRAGEETATVSVRFILSPDFDGTNREYEVTRSITSKGKHAIEVTMEAPDGTMVPIKTAGTRETQHWIEHDFLGASYELFVNSVVYPQGGRESFVEASAPRRKDLLLEILNVEDLDAYYEKARTMLKEMELKKAGEEGELRAIDRRIEELDLAQEDKDYLSISHTGANHSLREKEKKLSKIRAELAAANLDEESLKKDRARVSELRDVKARLVIVLDTTINELTELESLYATDKGKEEEYRDKANALTVALRDAAQANHIRNQLLADRPQFVDYEQAIAELMRQKDRVTKDLPTCPSGDECPFFQRALPEQQYLQEQINDRLKKKEAQDLAMKEWEERMQEIPESVDTSSIQHQLDHALLVLERLGEIERLETLYSSTNEEYHRVTNESVALYDKLRVAENHQEALAEVKGLERDIDAIRDEIVRLAQLMALQEARDKEKEDLLARKAVITEELRGAVETERKLSLVKEAFGSNGIRAIAIDQLIPRFEDKINEVLAKMSDFRIRLDTQRKNAKGDGTIEGLFITIRNDQNQELDFNSYSGGERLKITVAISEALASLQKAGFRILDELFVGLDEESTDSFAYVLSEIQGQFAQMICISHLRQIKDLFEDRVVAIKINGRTEVKHG